MYFFQTLLIEAVRRGKVTIINFLIEQGIDLNLRNYDGATALHYAVSSSYSKNLILEITQILVENGIDINIKNKWGNTALDTAKTYIFEEIISLLSNEERIKELIQLKNEIR